MTFVILFFLSYFLVTFAVPLGIKLAHKFNIVDQPDKRKIHFQPTPRVGGLILFSVISLLIISFLNDDSDVLYILICAFPLFLSGMLDDIKGISWKCKFLFQGITAVLFLIFFLNSIQTIEYFGIKLEFSYGVIILFFFIIGSLNSLNMLDGMDGLLTGYILIIVYSLIFISLNLDKLLILYFGIIILGANLAFLIFNIRPARIFLGDTGSLVLGYFLIILTLFISIDNKNKLVDLTFANVLFAVPLIDTLKVIFIRLKNNKSPFVPDKSHLHHTIYNELNYRNTVAIIHFLTTIFVIISVLYLNFDKYLGILLFIAFSFIQLCIKRIINLIKVYFNKILFNIRERISLKISLKVNNKILITLPSIMGLSCILLFFPLELMLNWNAKITVLTILFLFLFVIIINLNIIYLFKDFYFFNNIVIFFVLSCYSNSLFDKYIVLYLPNIKILISVILLILLFAIIILLLFSKTFYSNVYRITNKDLIIFFIVLLTIIFNNFSTFPVPQLFSLKVLIVFTFYLWYRAVILLTDSFRDYIFYFSAFLPIIVIIINL